MERNGEYEEGVGREVRGRVTGIQRCTHSTFDFHELLLHFCNCTIDTQDMLQFFKSSIQVLDVSVKV